MARRVLVDRAHVEHVEILAVVAREACRQLVGRDGGDTVLGRDPPSDVGSARAAPRRDGRRPALGAALEREAGERPAHRAVLERHDRIR